MSQESLINQENTELHEKINTIRQENTELQKKVLADNYTDLYTHTSLFFLRYLYTCSESCSLPDPKLELWVPANGSGSMNKANRNMDTSYGLNEGYDLHAHISLQLSQPTPENNETPEQAKLG